MANIARFGSAADPFGSLVDDLFKGFLVRPVGYEAAERGAAGPQMRVEIAENATAYLLSAELPGVRKEDIEVSIDGAQITLAAEVKREKAAAQDERVLHAERSFGKTSRSFTLPQELDEEKAEARFRDGVLELTLPKKAATARKSIAIN